MSTPDEQNKWKDPNLRKGLVISRNRMQANEVKPRDRTTWDEAIEISKCQITEGCHRVWIPL